MRRPVAFEIAPSRWVKVRYVDEVQGDCDGLFYYSNEGDMAIDIRKDLNGQNSLSVLIHELSHAAIHVSGQNEIITEKQEEAFCKLNEMLWTHIIRFELNNKHIKWAYIDD